MRSLLTLVIAAAGLMLAAVGLSAAGTHEVTTPGQLFAPGRSDVLVGDSVTWRNTDHVTHSVTAEDGSFDSGDLVPGATFSRAFSKPGAYRFYCRIHRFMRGTVVVSEVVLRGPEKPVAAGARATLRGVAPTPGAEVVLERGSQVLARTTSASDGSFAFELVPEAGARYRARSGKSTSAEIAVAVAPRVTLSTSGGVLRVTASPALPGAWVRIEAYSRERFGWQRFRSTRLGANSTAALKAAPRRTLRLRARVLALNGYADGVSGSVVAGGSGHH
jgi:plastocyanin